MLDKTEQEIMSTWVLKPEIPVVTIRCLAYNHEKFIAQCLEGFLMQETTFSFEVVVHDDASTDNTANVIREYEAKYPHIIRAVYEEENQFQKKDGSLARIMSGYMRGKYIAFCEGDDFWTDKEKLQLQYDALEAHPECSICTCLVQQYDVDGITPLEKTVPTKKYNLADVNGVISQRDFAKLIWGRNRTYPFQTSSYFIRREARLNAVPELKGHLTRDHGILICALYCGSVYYYNRTMSGYRRNVSGSWSDQYKKGGITAAARLHLGDFYQDLFFDKCTNGEYRDIIFPSAIRRAMTVIDACYDNKTPEELFGKYAEMIGEEEFKRCMKQYIKDEPLKNKIKIRLALSCPKLYLGIEKGLRKVKRSK